MTELTTPAPENETPYQQTARAHAEDRLVRRFEAQPPEVRREALRRALATRDVALLRPLRNEKGLLSEADARRVDAALLSSADPVKFRQLVELAGQFDENGEPDPQTSAVTVADFSVGTLLKHVDAWACYDRTGEDVRAKVTKQLEADGPITLTDEEAHNPAAYRAARDLASQHGRELQVIGQCGEVEANMMPSSNGSGGPA